MNELTLLFASLYSDVLRLKYGIKYIDNIVVICYYVLTKEEIA
jgi:hypothetical protein